MCCQFSKMFLWYYIWDIWAFFNYCVMYNNSQLLHSHVTFTRMRIKYRTLTWRQEEDETDTPTMDARNQDQSNYWAAAPYLPCWSYYITDSLLILDWTRVRVRKDYTVYYVMYLIVLHNSNLKTINFVVEFCYLLTVHSPVLSITIKTFEQNIIIHLLKLGQISPLYHLTIERKGCSRSLKLVLFCLLYSKWIDDAESSL